jgi:hypothetical protein
MGTPLRRKNLHDDYYGDMRDDGILSMKRSDAWREDHVLELQRPEHHPNVLVARLVRTLGHGNVNVATGMPTIV